MLGQHSWLYTYSLEHQAFLQTWDPSYVIVTTDSLHLTYTAHLINQQGQSLGEQSCPVASYSLRFLQPDTLSLDGVPYVMLYNEPDGQMMLWNEEYGGYKFSTL